VPCDEAIVVVAEHLSTGSCNCQIVQLHPVVEEIVMLLLMTLVLMQRLAKVLWSLAS
jgi:hypothetical protein